MKKHLIILANLAMKIVRTAQMLIVKVVLNVIRILIYTKMNAKTLAQINFIFMTIQIGSAVNAPQTVNTC